MDEKKLTRREFLRIAGASAIAVPAAITGYVFYRSASGEYPLSSSPYQLALNEVNVLESDACPLLLLIDDHNTKGFGAYLGEILLAEGLNCIHLDFLETVTSDKLKQYDIVLLTEGSLDTRKVEIFENYVFHGGNLVAMRPDSRLALLLGLEAQSGNLDEGYLQVESNHPITEGISTESLQYHGTANKYRLSEAQALAWLSSSSNMQGKYPAITVNKFGNGLAAMWAFDLARSVAYMRQGNPVFANQERDELNGVRTVDMFKDWIDLDRIEIPQADEQQRLLVNLLVAISQEKRPLPRLWYFPGRANGMFIATGDSHMNPAPFVEEVLALVEQRNGRMSVYYSPQLVNDWGRVTRRARFILSDHVPLLRDRLIEKFTSPTPSMVNDWRERGHEFTLHPWVEVGLEEGWHRYWQEFTGRGYEPVSPTVRTHRILWSGWVETARVQAMYGIGMNFDYYHVGPSLQKENGEWVYGHLTGSGQPMKFIDEMGRILNIYQQNTQLADEHLMAMDVPGWGGWPDLSSEEAIEVSRTLMRRSVRNGGFSAITGQFHIDPFQVGGEAAAKARRWLEGTLDYAADLGLPIWSGQEWLKFTEVRHDARLSGIRWSKTEKRLSFQLNASENPNVDLTVQIPVEHNTFRLSQIEVDGAVTSFDKRNVGSIKYAWVPVSAQTHVFSAVYE